MKIQKDIASDFTNISRCKIKRYQIYLENVCKINTFRKGKNYLL